MNVFMPIFDKICIINSMYFGILRRTVNSMTYMYHYLMVHSAYLCYMYQQSLPSQLSSVYKVSQSDNLHLFQFPEMSKQILVKNKVFLDILSDINYIPRYGGVNLMLRFQNSSRHKWWRLK